MGRKRRPNRHNGDGTISYRKSRKLWEARLTVGWRPVLDESGRPVRLSDGTEKRRPVRKTVTAKTEDEAREKLRELRRLHDLGVDLDPNQTVAEFLAWWHSDVLPRSVSEGTVVQYGESIRNHINPTIGHVKLSKLSVRHVDRMLAAVADRGLSPNTQRLARAVLRRALRRAEADGLVVSNVAALAEGVRVRPKPGRSMTGTEAVAFLDHVHQTEVESIRRLAAGWTVALTLGLRLGELLGLAWSDVELDSEPSTMSVRRQLKRVKGRGLVVTDLKTRQSQRRVHLPSTTRAALLEHRERQAVERAAAAEVWEVAPFGHDLVFRTPLGTAVDPSNFRSATKRASVAALGEPWSPHELRHSAASLLLAQGVELKLISDTLGHSSIRVTGDVYAHLLNEGRSSVADAMDRAVAG